MHSRTTHSRSLKTPERHLYLSTLIVLFALLCSAASHAFTTRYWRLPPEVDAGGFDVTSTVDSRHVGTSMTSAGDFNGDGIPDLLIGASGAGPADQPVTGVVYVLYGTEAHGNRAPIDVETITAQTGLVISGFGNSVAQSGLSLAGAGDLNGDGNDDIVISSPQTGESTVVFGSETHGDVFDIAAIDGTNGFAVIGESTDSETGHVAAAAGDFNGDGQQDLLLTAPFYDANGVTNSGRAYVLYGRSTFPSAVDLGALASSDGLVLDSARVNEEVGYSATALGDFNADGFSDIALGAFGVDAVRDVDDNGRVYVVYGSAQPGGSLDLNQLDGSNGFRIEEFNGFELENHGMVGWTGDINGDGFDDFSITYNDLGTQDVKIGNLIILGHPRTDARFDPSEFTSYGTPSFRSSRIDTVRDVEQPVPARTSFSTITGIGDVDNDGYDDLVVTGIDFFGAPFTNLVYGDRHFPRWFPDTLSSIRSGFEIRPRAAGDIVGVPAGHLGDVNDDGYEDFAVSDVFNDASGVDNGRVQVVLGRESAGGNTGRGVNFGHSYTFGNNVAYSEGGIEPTPNYEQPPEEPDPEDNRPDATGVGDIGPGFLRGLMAEYLFDDNYRDNSRWKNNLSSVGSPGYETVKRRRGVLLRSRDRHGLKRASNSRVAVRGHLSIAFSARLKSNQAYSPVVGHFTNDKLFGYYIPSFSVQMLPRGTVQFVFKRPSDAFLWICTSRPGKVNHGRVNHFVFTRNRASGRVNIFMNGALVDSCNGPPGAMTGEGRQLRIGTMLAGIIDDATTDLFIDDLQIYGRLLNATEVRTLSRASTQVPSISATDTSRAYEPLEDPNTPYLLPLDDDSEPAGTARTRAGADGLTAQQQVNQPVPLDAVTPSNAVPVRFEDIGKLRQ